jgi:hypothetical protein
MLLPLLFIAAVSTPDNATDPGMVRQPPTPGPSSPDNPDLPSYTDHGMVTGGSSQPAFHDDAMVRKPPHEDEDGDDEGERDDDQPRKKDEHQHGPFPHRGHHHHYNNLGFSVAIHGGLFVRTRNDLAHVGWALGPAGEPARLGGLFDGELTLDVGKHLRIGAAIIWSELLASGRGTDLGNLDVRQNVSYTFLTGGLIVDGVIPLSKTVDLSLGATLGAGELTIQSFTARITDFSGVGVDLRAIPKSQWFQLFGTTLHVRPAVGLRLKLGQHPIAAIDVRVGLNIYYVPGNFLRLADDMPLQNSPQIVDLHPYLMLGVALGDFARRR